MQKIRLGVIGTGLAWERLHLPALQQLRDKYEVVAVCDTGIAKAQAAAAQLGLAQDRVYSDHRIMLRREDIDAVDVLVPIPENFDVAQDVIRTGKGLIAEKPLAATLDGARELIALKNRHGTKVIVAENFRYEEFSAIIKEALGQIGEVAYFIFNTGADFEADMTGDTFGAKEWRQHPDFAGGIFLDGGVHDIALMRYLFGDAQNVQALAARQDKDYCPWRNINAIMQFSNGVIGSYNYWSSAAELAKPPVGLRIFGSLGEIVLESKECGVVQVLFKDGRSEQKPFEPGKGYYNELLNFHSGDIVSTPEKELGDMELVFKILSLIQEG
jgi:predicted dehydrogenase